MVSVADNGSPSLTATQAFDVIVTEFVQATLGTMVLQTGQDGCLAIVLDSTEPITNVAFQVTWPSGTLTNFAIQPLLTAICSSNLQILSSTQALVTLSVCPGQALTMTQGVEVAELCFSAIDGQMSGFVELLIPQVVVTRHDGTQATNHAIGAGRTVVVGDRSLLEAVVGSDGHRQLFLYGQPGSIYQIESTTNLAGVPIWQLACRVPMTGPALVVCCTDLNTPTIFYRAFRYSEGPTNRVPTVTAGPDQFIHTNVTTLYGAASDDGLPAACKPLTYAWTNIAGPAQVSFSSPTSVVTAATFSQPGAYILRLSVSDSQDIGHDDIIVTWDCLFSGSNAWTANISRPSTLYPELSSGSVLFTNCEATLTEGDSFLVAIEKMFTIPAAAGQLCVTYKSLTFDTTATGRMGDVFEAALVNADGRPLSFTIQGAAGVTPAAAGTPLLLPPRPDTFFNHTDGRLPFTAPGATLQQSGGLTTVIVDVSSLAVGSAAKLILRLVNNDFDRATTIRITDVRFKPADASLNLAGSPSTALSILPGASGAVSAGCDIALNFSGNNSEGVKTIGGTPGIGGIRTPLLTVSSPPESSRLAPGTWLLSGRAEVHTPELSAGVMATNGIGLVTLNGVPCEGVDAAGNFFSPAEVRVGQNHFEVVALDVFNQATTNTITVFGVQCPANFSKLGVISPSIEAEYGRTSFNEWTEILYADFKLRNIGTYMARAPVYVGVTRISDPSVRLLSPDGVSSDGVPYYDFSATVTNGVLNPQQSTFSRALAFRNPKKVQFTFEVLVLGQINHAPSFASVPPTAGIVGLPYRYEAQAIDPDGDTLTYSLNRAPAAFSINGTDGSAFWLPDSENLGSHEISIKVEDSRGGSAEQSYILSVMAPPPNRPPFFVSVPVAEAYVGVPYDYQADALDPDGDPLTFAFTRGPAGMSVTASTGRVSWSPTAEQLGLTNVTLTVSDGRGGTADQSYSLLILANPTNRAPVVISQPIVPFLLSQPVGGGELVSLQNWSVFQFAGTGNFPTNDIFTPVARWTFDSNFMTATQVVNGQPSILLSDFVVADDQIKGKWFVDANNDDDFIGFVFGYQDPRRFYVFDWKAVDQLDTARGFTPKGFCLKAFTTAAPLQINDLWTRTNIPGRRTILYLNTNAPGWAYRTPYDFTLEYHPTEITVSVQGPGVSERFTVAHTNYASGRFGFYNYSQNNVVYQGFTREILPPSLYKYQVVALDADDDPLRFSLLLGPPGMAIDPGSGLISWTATTNNLGTHGVSVRIADGRGGVTDHSFILDVLRPGSNTLRGLVFDDRNRTGLRDGVPLESGLSNWTAYFDQNNNGRRDEGERVAITSAAGEFALTGLPAGTYSLGLDVLPGYVQTAPSNRFFQMTLTNQAVSNLLFGAVRPTNAFNANPRFVSSPPTNEVTALQTFRYFASALDDDADALSFDLARHPEGMLIQSNSGIVGWRPNLGDVGAHDVILRVMDGRGGVKLQSFQIMVVPPNTPPVFVSIPRSSAVVSFPYRYQVQAQDADGDPLAFRLAPGGTGSPPSGMSINTNSGLITWTPSSGQVGPNRVVVIARDARGAESTQSFDVSVVPGATNTPPVITSIPRRTIGVGLTYAYQVQAADPDSNLLLFSFDMAPAGMTFSNSPVTHGSRLIVWTPAASQLGTNSVTIRVNDGRGGIALQSFEIKVVSALENRAPAITSTPDPVGVANRLYQYDLAALDPDGDVLQWNLVAGPSGMSLDPLLGTLRWLPSLEERGTHEVVVQVEDAYLATAVQRFSLYVRAVNQPPSVTSTPPTEGATGRGYFYAVRAADPENDRLFFSTVVAPSNMTIEAGSGLIRWTPTTAQTGTNAVTIQVSDGNGGVAVQNYVVIVRDTNANRPPVITSEPLLAAAPGVLYRYQITAADPDGDGLRFVAFTALPSGMTLNTDSGLLLWTPTGAQTGVIQITIGALDSYGGAGRQTFTIRVQGNQPPAIASTPAPTVLAGRTYRYDVRAVDPEGSSLTYRFGAAPDGMSIDSLGRVAWITSPVNPGTNRVEIIVSDPHGASVTQTYDLTVLPDTEPPRVTLTLVEGLVDSQGGWAVDLGMSIRFQVAATDNLALDTPALSVAGSPVLLDGAGVGVVQPMNLGFFDVSATAQDLAGNVGIATNRFRVIDRGDTNRLTIQIHSPTNGAVLTGPVNLIASITNISDIVEYRVDFAHAEQALLENLSANPSAFIPLAHASFPPGTRRITNAVLAVFDPTILLNDSYIIRVFATDINGRGLYEGVVVNVQGNLKLGELRLEFTDLAAPAGIPITVKRVYDSRESNRQGDFGYGWSLGIQDARVLETGKKPLVSLLGEESTFTIQTRVYLTTPDGRRVGFQFAPEIAELSMFGPLYRGAFTSDPGVYDRLQPFENAASYVIHPDGTFRALLFNFVGYDASGYRLTTKDGTTYDYGETDGLRRVTDLNGNRLEYSHDGIFHYSGTNTIPDQKVVFRRDSLGRITHVIDPAGRALIYTYDGAGNLRSFTDRVSNATQYTYSAARAHYLTNIIDPLGRSALHMEYDADGRLVSITDAMGHPISQEFDAESLTGTLTDANGNIIVSRYDQRGNEVMRALEGVYTNRFAYDTNNNLIAFTNGRGFSTNYAYDARGNVTAIMDALSNGTRIAYNELNKPIGVTNALGQTLSLRYDGAGHLVEAVNNAGLSTTVVRDSFGRMASVVDAAGNTIRFEYEAGCACGRPGKIINPDGSFRLYEYNALGQTNRIVNELGAETLFQHDDGGRLLWIRDPLSNFTYFRHRGPLLTNVVDALGRSTRYEYDALNRTNKIIDAEGGIVEFRYDNNGNRTHVIDPLTNGTTFIYDAGNRLVQQIDPLGHTNFYAYDAAGNRTEAIDRNGRRRTFAYDALNRMTNELWWDGVSVVRSIVFGFNALGVQVLAADPAARYDYAYDALNRLERVAQTAVPGQPDFTLSYTYTALGQVASVTDNYGVSVGSGYDNRNRLAQRVWQGPGLDPARLDFAYDVTGNRTRTDRYADLAGTNRIGFTTYAYNSAGLVTNITHLGPASQVLAKYDYTFDSAYQITGWSVNDQPSQFDYDQTGQLTNALNAAQPNENFRYDANGNRVGAQSSGSYVVGRNNQILSDGTNNYAYDGEGNMTARSNTVTGVLTTYQFDYRNRLISVVDRNPDGVAVQTVAFAYDFANRRLNKGSTDYVNRFTYNRGDSWADLNATNAVIARYLLGGAIDELLVRKRASEGLAWYLTDRVGTVRSLIDGWGAKLGDMPYSAFGTPLSVSSPWTDRFTFTGRELDSESGLLFFRNRYYSPALGRFINEDPLRLIADVNLYRYVRNQPFVWVDPLGLVAVLEYHRTIDNPVNRAAFGIIGYVHGFAVANLAGAGAIVEFANGNGSFDIGAIRERAEQLAEPFGLYCELLAASGEAKDLDFLEEYGSKCTEGIDDGLNWLEALLRSSR